MYISIFFAHTILHTVKMVVWGGGGGIPELILGPGARGEKGGWVAARLQRCEPDRAGDTERKKPTELGLNRTLLFSSLNETLFVKNDVKMLRNLEKVW
jgi:hypothetical protein